MKKKDQKTFEEILDDAQSFENVKVEVVDEVETETIKTESNERKTFEQIQEEIKRLQSSQEKRKEKGSILSDINMNQLDKEVKELFTQAESIRKATDVQGDGESFLVKASKIIPYFGKKMVEKAEETMFDSSSLQESIDKFMDSMTKARTRANKYLAQITDRQDALEDNLQAGQNISQYVNEEILKLQEKNEKGEFTKEDKKEFNRWIVLKTNLDGINQANEFALMQTEKAQMTTYGMTQNMNNLQPILQGVLETQGEIAGQNVMNKLMIETIDVGKKLVNQIQVQNQRDSNHLLEQTIKIATDPMIEKETLKQLNVGLKEGNKRLQVTMQKQAQQIKDYNKQINENQKTLKKYGDSNLLVDFDIDLPEIDYKEESKETESKES